MDNVRDDILAQVVQRDGKVLLLFSQRNAFGDLVSTRTDHFMMDANAAIGVAECLSSMAFEADTKLKPVGDTLKASLVQQHREKLIPRVALMLNSMRENRNISNGQLATQIMDAFCAEVFS